MIKKIAIGSDHGGFELKEKIILHLKQQGIEAEDCGCYSSDSVDYPDIAETVCKGITDGKYERAILICGTGIGISIAANKIRGIRAALCHSCFDARMSRMHNDANVLCLGARTTGVGVALDIVDVYMASSFEGDRHIRRINKITALEELR